MMEEISDEFLIVEAETGLAMFSRVAATHGRKDTRGLRRREIQLFINYLRNGVSSLISFPDDLNPF